MTVHKADYFYFFVTDFKKVGLEFDKDLLTAALLRPSQFLSRTKERGKTKFTAHLKK